MARPRVRLGCFESIARFEKLVYYKQAAGGGHFAAIEHPQEFVEGVRTAFRGPRF